MSLNWSSIVSYAKDNKAYFFYIVLLAHILYVLIGTHIEEYFHIGDIDLEDIDDVKANIPLFFVYAVVLAPILEELLYRFPLKRDLLALAVIPIGLILFNYDSIVWGAFDAFYLLLIIVYQAFSIPKLQRFLVIVSILVFTFSHSVNYSVEDLESLNVFEFFILFDSQLLLALVTTFLRFVFGFSWAYLYHLAYNLIVFFIGLLTM